MRFRLHMPLLPNATIAIAIAGVPPPWPVRPRAIATS